MNDVPFTLLGFGFLLGIRHAFDVDHIAAVSAIVSKHKSIKKSSLLGIFWGFGHTISLLIIGLIVLLLKITIPEKIALSFEFIVGIMLVILGLNVLLTINKNKVHFHKHKHGKEEHIHFHSHKLTKHHDHKHKLFHQSLFIGLIHGLAGSAVLTLLVLTTIKSVWLGLIYTLIFGIGSIIGMILISSVISLPFNLIPNNFQRIQKFLRISAGLVSTIIGLNIMYNIGIAEGLLI
ncbi:MAG: sulfite exporter TauE/SafE family protein [Nanoarchaeota archaeon]|nr:sulfite exporter TauE/SafE family protein [Nanoarchaeota archaeon]